MCSLTDTTRGTIPQHIEYEKSIVAPRIINPAEAFADAGTQEKTMKKIIAVLLIALYAAACGGGVEVPDADKMAEEANAEAEAEQKKMEEQAEAEAKAALKMDVVDTAIASENFTTLVSALTAAELVEALKGEGPFTVFAPTDEAFAALPEGTLEELMKPEGKETLQNILKFHVVPAKVMAADVQTMGAETLAGAQAEVVVNEEDGSVTYAGANVTQTDIDATNGVIHVIDAVVMPPAEGTASAEGKASAE